MVKITYDMMTKIAQAWTQNKIPTSVLTQFSKYYASGEDVTDPSLLKILSDLNLLPPSVPTVFQTVQQMPIVKTAVQIGQQAGQAVQQLLTQTAQQVQQAVQQITQKPTVEIRYFQWLNKKRGLFNAIYTNDLGTDYQLSYGVVVRNVSYPVNVSVKIIANGKEVGSLITTAKYDYIQEVKTLADFGYRNTTDFINRAGYTKVSYPYQGLKPDGQIDVRLRAEVMGVADEKPVGYMAGVSRGSAIDVFGISQAQQAQNIVQQAVQTVQQTVQQMPIVKTAVQIGQAVSKAVEQLQSTVTTMPTEQAKQTISQTLSSLVPEVSKTIYNQVAQAISPVLPTPTIPTPAPAPAPTPVPTPTPTTPTPTTSALPPTPPPVQPTPPVQPLELGGLGALALIGLAIAIASEKR